MPYLATALGLNVGSGNLPPKIKNAPDVPDGADMKYGIPPAKTEQPIPGKKEETVVDEPLTVENLLNIPIPEGCDKTKEGKYDKGQSGENEEQQQMSEEIVYEQVWY